MSILLTGGAGYIGSHVAVELLNKNYDLIVADDFSNSSPKVLNRIKKITGKNFKFYEVNVAKKNLLKNVFEENKIDGIIHFAGYKAVGESVTVPLKYYRNNIDSTLSLLETMENFRVKNFVFSSSATVYGEFAKSPCKETHSTGNCTNPYGWTKYMIEQILKDYCIAENDFSCISLRYFNPVGAHDSGLMGEDPNGIPNNLMPFISQVAVGKLKKLSVFGNDYNTSDGTGVRDFIHVVDLAKGHVCAIEYSFLQNGFIPINLGTGVGYSVMDMVNTFKDINEIDVPYEITNRRAGDIDCLYSDASKAEELLSWKAEKTLSDMCKDTWNWQKNNPNGYE